MNHRNKREKWIGQPGLIGLRVTLLLLLACSLGLCGQLYIEEHFKVYQETLRFHVRADSDEAVEQELKYKVRDRVLQSLEGLVQQASSGESLRRELADREEEISQTAAAATREAGTERTVRAYITRERFPVRRYGGVVFPAGEYWALRVDIGRAEGHNWWCAIYPELCYNAEESLPLSEKGKKDMEEHLPKEEEEVLTGQRKRWIFRIWNWLAEK